MCEGSTLSLWSCLQCGQKGWGGLREGQAGGPCLCLLLAFPNSLSPPHLGTIVRGCRNHLDPGLNCLPLACSNSLHLGHFLKPPPALLCLQTVDLLPKPQALPHPTSIFHRLGMDLQPHSTPGLFPGSPGLLPPCASHPINAASASLPPASSASDLL